MVFLRARFLRSQRRQAHYVANACQHIHIYMYMYMYISRHRCVLPSIIYCLVLGLLKALSALLSCPFHSFPFRSFHWPLSVLPFTPHFLSPRSFSFRSSLLSQALHLGSLFILPFANIYIYIYVGLLYIGSYTWAHAETLSLYRGSIYRDPIYIDGLNIGPYIHTYICERPFLWSPI